jgi:hypothetical protein
LLSYTVQYPYQEGQKAQHGANNVLEAKAVRVADFITCTLVQPFRLSTKSFRMAKDPMQEAYLKHLRERNIRVASECSFIVKRCSQDPGYKCGKQTVGINSDGYRINFVCEEHHRDMIALRIDTSMPGVVHYIYPEGKDPGFMNITQERK